MIVGLLLAGVIAAGFFLVATARSRRRRDDFDRFSERQLFKYRS